MAIMQCVECGKDVSSQATSCPHCGRPVSAPAVQAVTVRNTPASQSGSALVPKSAEGEQPGNGIAVGALVLGILGLTLFWVPLLGGFLALFAILLGGQGMKQARKILGVGKGLAIAGLVMGIVAIVPAIVFSVMMFIAVTPAFSPQLNTDTRKLDAQQLTTFYQKLQLRSYAEDRKTIQGIPDQGSAAKLFVKLYEIGLLSADDIGLLAGASGEAASGNALRNRTWNTDKNIIFTGPSDGATLVRLMNGSTKDGVLFSYNKNFIAEDEPIVVFFAGAKKAELLTAAEIRDRFNASGGSTSFDDSALTTDYFWGKAPFRSVRPE